MSSSPKTLMVVGAHHDDNEGNAAGLMVRHRKAGWRVVSVVMTNGRWSRGAMSDETIAVRNQESLDAAALLDVETVFMMPAETYAYVSSRLVKEVFALGGSVSGLVPKVVEERLRHKKKTDNEIKV